MWIDKTLQKPSLELAVQVEPSRLIFFLNHFTSGHKWHFLVLLHLSSPIVIRLRTRLVHFEQRRLYTGSLIESEEIVVLPSALISSEGLVHVIGTEGFACSDFI